MKLYAFLLFLMSFKAIAANPKILSLCTEYTRVYTHSGFLTEYSDGTYELNFQNFHMMDDHENVLIYATGHKVEPEYLDLDSIDSNFEEFVFFDEQGKKTELTLNKTLVTAPSCPSNNPRGACDEGSSKSYHLLEYTITHGDYQKSFACKKYGLK